MTNRLVIRDEGAHRAQRAAHGVLPSSERGTGNGLGDSSATVHCLLSFLLGTFRSARFGVDLCR
jgi:hypothetical protein